MDLIITIFIYLFITIVLFIVGIPIALILYFFSSLHKKIVLRKFLKHYLFLILVYICYLFLSFKFTQSNLIIAVVWALISLALTTFYGKKIVKIRGKELIMFVSLITLAMTIAINYY